LTQFGQLDAIADTIAPAQSISLTLGETATVDTVIQTNAVFDTTKDNEDELLDV